MSMGSRGTSGHLSSLKRSTALFVECLSTFPGRDECQVGPRWTRGPVDAHFQRDFVDHRDHSDEWKRDVSTLMNAVARMSIVARLVPCRRLTRVVRRPFPDGMIS